MQNKLRGEVRIIEILLIFQSAENQCLIVLIHERPFKKNKKTNCPNFLEAQPMKDEKTKM